MESVQSQQPNQDLDDEPPGSRTIGRRREDFDMRSSAGWSEEVAIPLNVPTLFYRLGGLAKKENFPKQNKQIAGNGDGGGVSQRNVC